jgi:hypothetical protein
MTIVKTIVGMFATWKSVEFDSIVSIGNWLMVYQLENVWETGVGLKGSRDKAHMGLEF